MLSCIHDAIIQRNTYLKLLFKNFHYDCDRLIVEAILQVHQSYGHYFQCANFFKCVLSTTEQIKASFSVSEKLDMAAQ